MKITWKFIALAGVLALSATTSQAEFVGLNIGARYWEPDTSGSFFGDARGDNPRGLVGNPGIDNPIPSNLVLTLEHPISLLPNIRYQSLELDSSGFTSSANFTYDNNLYTGPVTSTFDLSHSDLLLYYEVLDNWVSLDFGLEFRVFDGEVILTDTAGPFAETVVVDETIPLLYLSARFDLPFNGFYIGADLNGASTGDNSLEDTSIMLGYESGNGLGIEGGIKKFSLELNDVTDVNTNLEYDGFYLNGYYLF